MKTFLLSPRGKFTLAILVSLLIAFNAFSATNWNGSVSNNWALAANWSAGLPSATQDANIPNNPSGGVFPVISTGTVYTKNITIAAGATVTQTGGTLNINHDWHNSGVFNATGGLVQFSTSAGAGANFSTGTNQFYNILVDANIDPGFDNNANSKILVGGNYTNNNTSLNNTVNTKFTFNGTGTQTITTVNTGVNTTFGTVILNKASGTLLLASAINIDGSWTNNSGTLNAAGNQVIFSGTNQTIGGTISTPFDGIVIGSGGSYTLNYNLSCSYLTFLASAGASSLTQASGTSIIVNGNVTINQPTSNGTTNWKINNTTATVNGNILIGNTNASNNRISKITITTGTLNINGNLVYKSASTHAQTAVVDMSGGAGTMNISGAITLTSNSGTLTPGGANTGSVVNYMGSVAQSIVLASSINYNNLFINNSSSTGATLAAMIDAASLNGNLFVQSGIFNNGGYSIAGTAAKTFSVANGATFNLSGTSTSPTSFGTDSYGVTSSTNYLGTNQSVGAETYGNLFLSGSGIKTVGSSTVVAGNLITSGTVTLTSNEAVSVYGDVSIGSGTTWNANNFTHSVKGDFSNSGVYNAGSSTMLFNGSGVQVLSGNTTFYNVTLNNSNDLNLSSNLNLTDTLNFLNGKINTGSNLVYINTGKIIGAGVGKYVNGILKIFISGSSNVKFEVGDATNYTPLLLSSLSPSDSGIMTVQSIGMDHPSIALSAFDANKTVNRYWDIASTSLNLTTATITATYVVSDVDPGMNTSLGQIALFDGTDWSYPNSGNSTATSAQATELDNVATIQIGEVVTDPNLYSLSPSFGDRLQTLNVTFTGSNFIAGTSSVTVGSNITVNSVTVNSSTSLVANLTINASAATGNRNFRVVNSGPFGATSNRRTFRVNNPLPTLSSISPLNAPLGQTLNVVFTGSKFISGATSINVGAGITVNSVNVTSSTSLTANITILPSASAGNRDFTVTNTTPGGGTSAIQTFTIDCVYPTLSSILPVSGNRLQTLNVVLTGTGFVNGLSTVNVGAGVTINSTTVSSATSITVNVTIAANAATGNMNFSVTNGTCGSSVNQIFAINNPAPTLSGISPVSGALGQTLNVTFTGTNFINGVSSISVGAGITINTVTVSSSTSLVANITIAAGASAGTRNFSVTNAAPGGGTSANQTFTINCVTPTLSSLSPVSATRLQTLNVTLTGTGYVNGLSSVNVGAGVTINSTTVSSATSIVVNITITASASTGNMNFSVTNGACGTSVNHTISISNPSPTLTSISPISGSLGQTLNVTFTGTNFISGVSSVTVGSGITINSVTVSSSTSLIANLSIASGTTIGTRNFSVTNSAPGGGTSVNQIFTINCIAPTLSSILPVSGNRLQTLNVVLTGTGFVNGLSAVNVGAGVTINSTTVSSATSITVNVTIAANAATGNMNFSVTNGTCGSSVNQIFAISNPAPTLTGISPNGGAVGQTLDVTFSGTNFISGVSSVSVGAGITVNLVTVSNSTTLVANISIAIGATIGTRNFSVLNSLPGGGSSANQVFTVNMVGPTLTSVVPSSGFRLQTLNVVLVGSNFINGVSSINLGTGIIVNSFTVNSSVLATANITITALAATGTGNISVTNSSGGGTSGNQNFNVNNPLPTFTSISPASVNRGVTMDVAISGSNFLDGVTTVDMGSGIVINSTLFISSSALKVNISIQGTTNWGIRVVTVSNPSPIGGIAGQNFFVANNKVFVCTGGAWDNSSCWNPVGIPNQTDEATIPFGYTCYVPATATVKSDTLKVYGNFKVMDAYSVQINRLIVYTKGSLMVNGGLPMLKDTTGTLNPNSASLQGFIDFCSSSSQTISSFCPLQKVNISGSGIKTLAGDLTIWDSLTVAGSLAGGSSTLELKNSFVNNGSFDAQTGDVKFSGTSSQSIGGTTVTTFNNIDVTNTSGVTLASNENVSGIVTLAAGTSLNTAGKTLTIISNASGTGRIGPVPAGVTITGNVDVQRYVSPAAGYRMMGVPVSGATIAQLASGIPIHGLQGSSCSGCTPNFWFYDETVTGSVNNGWTVPSAGVTTSWAVGRGAFINKTNATSATVTITGPVVTGTVNIPVTYTPSNPPSARDDGWFLAANPYPCDIDWDALVGWTKTNISTSVYIWDPAINDYRYHQYGVGGSTSGYIGSSQAFWVKATGANPVLKMTESVKVTTTNPYYKLSDNITDALTIRIAAASDTSKYDEACIRFTAGAVASYDPEFDSHRLTSDAPLIPNIATASSEDVNLALNSMPPLDQNVDIPVKVKVNTTGTYILSSENLAHFFPSSCIILDDLVTGVKTDLRAHSYSCQLTAGTSLDQRFLLHVAPPIKLEVFPSSCAGSGDGKVIAKGQSNGPWSYKWTDLSGYVIKSTPPKNEADTIFNLPGGSYLISVTNAVGYCSIITQRFEVIAPDPIVPNVVSANVNCYGSKNGTVQILTYGGSAPYQYKWNDGNSQSSRFDLAAETYSVLVSDALGCIVPLSINISEPAPLIANIAGSDVWYCENANGTAESKIFGGTEPYQYKWSNGAGTQHVENLSPGTYHLTVTDNNQCIVTESIYINREDPIHMDFTANTDSVYLSNGGNIMFMNETENAIAYKWYFGDGSSSDLRNPEHAFKSPGLYKVKMVAFRNSCSDSLTMNIAVVGIDGNDKLSISPNPNPGNELKVLLKDVDAEQISIIVYDENGKALMNKNIIKSENHFTLDLTAGGQMKLKPGIYMISVIAGKESYSKKLIITSSN